jgi:hypothetical protein
MTDSLLQELAHLARTVSNPQMKSALERAGEEIKSLRDRLRVSEMGFHASTTESRSGAHTPPLFTPYDVVGASQR